MFMQIVDNRSMVINATVNQVDIESLRLGQKATVHFDAYPDLELPARVISIGAMTKTGGMRQSYVKNIPVRLELERTEARVIPDLTVSADLRLESADAQAAVPLEAVFRDSPDGPSFVYARDGSRWKRRDIQTGLASNIITAVESGLKSGDVVALQKPPDEALIEKGAPPETPTKE